MEQQIEDLVNWKWWEEVIGFFGAITILVVLSVIIGVSELINYLKRRKRNKR